MFFNYGVDTGTVWKTESFHEPILWRHVSWDRRSPDREVKEQSPWGWLFYRRVKTGKTFHRPMNRTVHTHIKNIMPDNPDPDAPVFLGGGTRPNNRFRTLCGLAGIEAKTSVETEEKQPWVLRDLRKTCATYYDEHIPESSVEILGHSAGGVTYRHYAHRASRSAGIQGHNDPAPAVSLFGARQRFRRYLSVLSETIRGCFIARVMCCTLLEHRPRAMSLRPPPRLGTNDLDRI